MIKTDPSQTKTVVVLLLILGAAVVWTVMRISPGVRQQAAVSPAAAEAVQVGPEAVTVAQTFEPSRNPFRKPDIIRVAFGGSAQPGVDSERAAVREGGARPSGGPRIPPMSFGVVRTAGPEPSSATDRTGKDKTEPEKPTFELLAVVEGPGGFTAVVRCGESNTRVVAEGDLLDGGYKVLKLGAGLAVLRPSTSSATSTGSGWSGRDTIVLKRPS